jgi:CRISPR/Cas system-associated exonuclease Cas4 (RecB family)
MKKPVFVNEHDVEAEGLPSASGFDAEFRCLGKRALCSQLPKQEDSVVAARGTKIHKALEFSDLSDLAASDDKTASRIMYGEAKLVHEFDFEGAEVQFEHRLWDVDDDLNHTWSAKIDALHFQPDKRRALVPDYKSGWSLPPPIETNWQMRAQAALVADQYDAEEVVAALIHPHHAESLYEVRVFTREDLRDTLDSVRANVWAIQKPDMPRTPNGVSCQYCTAKRICPEYQAEQARIEQSVADEIEDRGFTAILRRSPAERGVHVRGIKQFIKDCQALMEQYVKMAELDESAVHGYTLKHRLTRKLTNEAEAMDLVRQEYGPDLLYDALHLSLPDLEEALGKKLSSKTDAKKAIQRLLNPVLKFEKSKNFLEEARSL